MYNPYATAKSNRMVWIEGFFMFEYTQIPGNYFLPFGKNGFDTGRLFVRFVSFVGNGTEPPIMRKLLFLASFEYFNQPNYDTESSAAEKELRIIVVDDRDIKVVFDEMKVASSGSSVSDYMTAAYIKGVQWFRRRISRDIEVKCTVIPAIDGIIVPDESFQSTPTIKDDNIKLDLEKLLFNMMFHFKNVQSNPHDYFKGGVYEKDIDDIKLTIEAIEIDKKNRE